MSVKQLDKRLLLERCLAKACKELSELKIDETTNQLYIIKCEMKINNIRERLKQHDITEAKQRRSNEYRVREVARA